MIARVWRGWTTPENAERYEHYFRDVVLPAVRGLGGYRGSRLMRRTDGDEIMFLTSVYFDSLEAVKRFSFGSDPDRTVLSPDAQRLLSRYESRVEHYDIVNVDMPS